VQKVLVLAHDFTRVISLLDRLDDNGMEQIALLVHEPRLSFLVRVRDHAVLAI
jgi:hypothetical protein